LSLIRQFMSLIYPVFLDTPSSAVLWSAGKGFYFQFIQYIIL